MLTKTQAENGDAQSYLYAVVYAGWGNSGKALEWLETAYRARDAGLETLKTDPAMDPLRKEPRFQAVMRALKFPECARERQLCRKLTGHLERQLMAALSQLLIRWLATLQRHCGRSKTDVPS